MTVYGCSFQHFKSGAWISGEYSRKKLYLSMQDSLDSDFINEMFEGMDEETKENNIKAYKETENWVNELNGKRFETVEEAEKHLKKLGCDVEFFEV